MKTKHIIIGFVVILIVLFLVQQKEHASSTPTTTPTLSNEAIQNIARIYADSNNTATFNNLRATGDVIGAQTTTNRLCIGTTCITETDLQKIASNKKFAGFAVDGGGTTMLLYEGYWILWGSNDENVNNVKRFDAFTTDVWDVAYINKGWKVQFWADAKSGNTVIIENKTDDIPKRVSFISHNFAVGTGSGGDGVSSYEATWVGY
jgi:hypothetical protein